MKDEQRIIAELTERLEQLQNEVDALRATPSPLRRFVKRAERYPFPRRSLWARLLDSCRALVPQTGAQLVQNSTLFDSDWYLNEYPQLQKSRLAQSSPAKHYFKVGAWDGLNPGPDFDTQWYLANYPDVRTAGINPLVHYVLFGVGEGRLAKP